MTLIGFSFDDDSAPKTGARSKRGDEQAEAPRVLPMRVGDKVRRNPSTDQKKQRRQQARKVAATEPDLSSKLNETYSELDRGECELCGRTGPVIQNRHRLVCPNCSWDEAMDGFKNDGLHVIEDNRETVYRPGYVTPRKAQSSLTPQHEVAMFHRHASVNDDLADSLWVEAGTDASGEMTCDTCGQPVRFKGTTDGSDNAWEHVSASDHEPWFTGELGGPAGVWPTHPADVDVYGNKALSSVVKRADSFWDAIDAELAECRKAKSADDVIRALSGDPEVAVSGGGVGDAFFGGSGGDNSLLDALSDAGWSVVDIKADYYWAMKAPNGDVISYIEGDVYRGNQLVKNSSKDELIDWQKRKDNKDKGLVDWEDPYEDQSVDAIERRKKSRESSKTAGARIDQFRKIVETKSFGDVDGQPCDLFSASAVTQVYDALGDANKAKFEAMSPASMVDVAFKLINKQGSKMNFRTAGENPFAKKDKKDDKSDDGGGEKKENPFAKKDEAPAADPAAPAPAAPAADPAAAPAAPAHAAPVDDAAVQAEVQTIAQTLAQQGLTGDLNDPLPETITTEAHTWINANVEQFKQMVAQAGGGAAQQTPQTPVANPANQPLPPTAARRRTADSQSPFTLNPDNEDWIGTLRLLNDEKARRHTGSRKISSGSGAWTVVGTRDSRASVENALYSGSSIVAEHNGPRSNFFIVESVDDNAAQYQRGRFGSFMWGVTALSSREEADAYCEENAWMTGKESSATRKQAMKQFPDRVVTSYDPNSKQISGYMQMADINDSSRTVRSGSWSNYITEIERYDDWRAIARGNAGSFEVEGAPELLDKICEDLPGGMAERHPFEVVGKRIDMSQQREAKILVALAKSASLDEQRALNQELTDLRHARRAAIAASREVQLTNPRVNELIPTRVHEHHTASTDWILESNTGAGDPTGIQRQATAEASLFFSRLHPAVIADREEFGEQTKGMAHRFASQFGEQYQLGFRTFTDHVQHLAYAHTAGEVQPGGEVDEDQSGNAESQYSYPEVGRELEPFDNFVEPVTDDASEVSSLRAPNVTQSRRRTAISLTNVGFEGGIGSNIGVGTDSSGNKVRFRLSDSDAKQLASVLTSDLAVNFSGVDIDESEIIKDSSRRSAGYDEKKSLKCDGWCDGANPVSMIGDKGYAYCDSCGVRRRGGGSERVRKLRPHELAALNRGESLTSYSAQADNGNGDSSLEDVTPTADNAGQSDAFPWDLDDNPGMVTDGDAKALADGANDVASVPTPGSSVADYPQPSNVSTENIAPGVEPWPTTGSLQRFRAAIQARMAAEGPRPFLKAASVDPELADLARKNWGGPYVENSLGGGFVSGDGLRYSWQDDTTLVCLADGADIQFRRSDSGWQYKTYDGWKDLADTSEADAEKFRQYQQQEEEFRRNQKVSDPAGYDYWLRGD